MPLLQLCYVHIMQFRIRHSTDVHLAKQGAFVAPSTVYSLLLGIIFRFC